MGLVIIKVLQGPRPFCPRMQVQPLPVTPAPSLERRHPGALFLGFPASRTVAQLACYL